MTGSTFLPGISEVWYCVHALPLTGIAALLGAGILDVDIFVQSQGSAHSASGAAWVLGGVLALIVLAMASRDRPA